MIKCEQYLDSTNFIIFNCTQFIATVPERLEPGVDWPVDPQVRAKERVFTPIKNEEFLNHEEEIERNLNDFRVADGPSVVFQLPEQIKKQKTSVVLEVKGVNSSIVKNGYDELEDIIAGVCPFEVTIE